MPRAGHRLFQLHRQAAALAARQESTARGRAVPRRGAADPHRGARQRAAARDHRFLGRGREASARRRDHRRDRSGGRRGDRDHARHPLQDDRQGQSADAARRLPPARRHRSSEIDRSTAPLWIVAQALRDPGNLGTILRTGDAVGAGGLILIDDCADPFSVEAVRASMGAMFTQQIATARWDGIPAVAALRARASWSAPASRQRHDYLDADYRQPCFLLIGNEQQGLPADYEARMRPARQDPDGRARRQPQRGDGDGGDGLRG